MTNSKNTKHALLASILSVVLCCAMLIGSTFAWFTDSASTAVNKIQAGTLDVALEMKDASGSWVTAEGQTLNWKKAAGAPAGEAVLWEPGCTYELPELRVRNNGSLALKYKLVVTGIVGDAKLLEAIDFTYGDGIDLNAEVPLAPKASTESIVIKGHMKEISGNEYQGLSIDGIGITVVAKQDTVEYDSFNNRYDANSEYAVYATDADSLQAALNSGFPVVLQNDISVDGGFTVTTPGTVVDLNGHNITSNAPADNQHSIAFKVSGDNANLTIKGDGNVRAEGSVTGANIAVWATNGGQVRIEGGNYSNSDESDLIYASYGQGTNKASRIEIYGGTFSSVRGSDNQGGMQPTCVRLLNMKNESPAGQIEVYGGTFVDFDVRKSDDWPQNNPTGSWIAAGYRAVETVTDGISSFTVVAD